MVTSTRTGCLTVLWFGWVVNVAQSSGTNISLSQKVVHWLESREGAFVNPKIEVRHVDPEDETSMTGVFAKETIEEDEILVHVPWDSLIHSKRDGEGEWSGETYQSCGTIHNLIDEFKKGDDSEFAPYIIYLKSQPTGQLPSSWSHAGQFLFMDILDGNSMSQTLPPYGPNHYRREWLTDCEGSIDDIDVAMLVISRADEDALVPVYDLSNHRNGIGVMNTIVTRKHGEYHQTMAGRTIEAGEQIYNSYNLCYECESRHDNFGTPEMFTDYGFIEGMPQRWYFFYDGKNRLRLELDEDDAGQIVANWNEKLSPKRKDAIRQFLIHELRRLIRLKKRQNKFSLENAMPENEWKAIWQYYDAIVNALTHGIESLGGSIEELCSNDGGDRCSHYMDLAATIEDDLPYPLSSAWRNGNPDMYELVETVVANDPVLGTIDFREATQHDDEEGEVCLFHNDELVLCPSFRPYVYETLVHFPAQLVERVRRVLIVGSLGDSAMTLYEVLKYPEIERVVVVEECPELARKNFEYFDTSPYWDEEIVEWWFGSTESSLQQLLYGGGDSFDLVILENADMVFASHDETITDTIACLLDDRGVVAGYTYGNHTANLGRSFAYSAEALFDDPVISKYQKMLLASHELDVLRTNIWEHDIDVLLFEVFANKAEMWEYLLNYNLNSDLIRENQCNISTMKGREIIDIVEMEGIETANNIQATLVDALSSHGHKSVTVQFDSSGFFVLVLEGGYITVRAASSSSSEYVGLDIHMWDGMHGSWKQVQPIAIKALEPNEVSSFRLVSSAKQQIQQEELHRDSVTDDSTTMLSVEDAAQYRQQVTSSVYSAPFLAFDEGTIGVICGLEGSQECQSYNVIESVSNTDSVTPLWTCPELENDDDTIENRAMEECERRLTKQLDQMAKEEKIHVLVVDESAKSLMLQVVDSMLSSSVNRMKWLASDHLLLSLSFDQDTDTLRRAFLDRFRQYVRDFPVARAEYSVESEVADVELGVVLSGYPDAFDLFRTIVDEFASSSATPVHLDLKRVIGGIISLPEDKGIYADEVYYYNDENAATRARFYSYQAMARLTMTRPLEGSIPSFENLVRTMETVYIDMDIGQVSQNATIQNNSHSVAILTFERGFSVVSYDGELGVSINIDMYHDSPDAVDDFVQRYFALLREQLDFTVTIEASHPRGIATFAISRGEVIELYETRLPSHHSEEL